MDKLLQKLPSVEKGPACYTIRDWAFRASLMELVIGWTIGGMFYYFSTRDDMEDSKTVFIIMGVIFTFPAVFGLLLMVAVLAKKPKLMYIYIIYGLIMIVLSSLLFFALGIMSFVQGNIGGGFIIWGIMVLITGYMIYNISVIHTIYLQDTEESDNSQSGGESA